MAATKNTKKTSVKSSKKPQAAESAQTRLLSGLSMIFFNRPAITFMLWISLAVLGLFSYLSWLDRQGFPSVQVPVGVATGRYFVDDSARVDSDITKPISSQILEEADVKSVTTQTGKNFFSIFVGYEESVDTAEAAKRLNDSFERFGAFPDQAQYQVQSINPAKFLDKYDVLVSVYSQDGLAAPADLDMVSAEVAAKLQLDEVVIEAEPISLFAKGVNPETSEEVIEQVRYSKLGQARGSGQGFGFNNSALIGLVGTEDLDVIDLSDRMNALIEDVSGTLDGNYGVEVTGDFAESITTQINSLQNNILSGLIAVTVISLLLISWRASIVTGLFMLSVIAVTLLVLLVIGYSLNTITLFALVLALGLFVDDATIIVESIDTARKSGKKSTVAVREAVSRVASASFAGTLTTVLVFLPLVFVSGVLGEFIRIMPVTIIISLIVSFVLSLTLIPFLSKYFILGESAKGSSGGPLTGAVDWLAQKISSLPLLLNNPATKTKGIIAAVMMSGLSALFLYGAFFYSQRVSFDIFPPTKDADELLIELSMPIQSSIEQSQQVSTKVDEIVASVVGENLVRVNYLNGSSSGATIQAILKPFNTRDIKSPQIVEALEQEFGEITDGSVLVRQIDAGPPKEEYPFKVQIFSDDAEKLLAASTQLNEFLQTAVVERPNGEEASITKTQMPDFGPVSRKDGKRFVEVKAGFDADDTTALVGTTEELVRDEFDEARLASFGLASDSLGFDFGQESESQDSFASMGIVGVYAMIAMVVLLAIQFRSLLQPLLIFLAIPFSLFGVTYGLYTTDNAISFFSMVGFFGLVGIAVNNTILLTDYANQERRAGNGKLTAISQATKKRLRPLLTTSLTTVAALLPLALSDPFWEALAYTIIFGLLSSTFLVITSFPYFYLGVEWFRGLVQLPSWRRGSN